MSNVVQLDRPTKTQTATIASGSAQTTGYFISDGFAIGMLHLPSTWDGTSLTFQVSPTADGTFVNYEAADGSAVTLTVEASKAYAIPEGLFGAPYFKVTSGSNQTTTDTIVTATFKG